MRVHLSLVEARMDGLAGKNWILGAVAVGQEGKGNLGRDRLCLMAACGACISRMNDDWEAVSRRYMEAMRWSDIPGDIAGHLA